MGDSKTVTTPAHYETTKRLATAPGLINARIPEDVPLTCTDTRSACRIPCARTKFRVVWLKLLSRKDVF